MATLDRELLYRIISDEDEAWQHVCAEVRECVRIDCAIAIDPPETTLEFLRQNDRRVVEGAARQLLSLGQRRRVLDALLQRLSEIVLLSSWISRTESTEDQHRAPMRPPPRSIPELRAGYLLLIGETGYRIVDENGVTRHRATLPPRLQRLLAACWACCWLKQQCGPGGDAVNAPVIGELDLGRLRKLIGTTANRANVAELRRHMSMEGGNSVLDVGKQRMFLLDFALDLPINVREESFVDHAAQFLQRHNIRVPEGFPAAVKSGVKSGVKRA
ncbi:MAG TPA: hypothetical protein VGP72_31485 [Planctomycetota bacterium]